MSVDALLSQLSGLDTKASTEIYHVLYLQYPAIDLLPPDTKCYIEPPKNVCQRNRPPSDLGLLGMTDSSFYTMLSTSSAQEPVQGQREHEKLLAAIEHLSNFPGESTLKVASYFDHREEVMSDVCTFKLESATMNKFKSTKEFVLDVYEMQALRTYSSRYQWIRLMDHVINRESDRAYYHVLQAIGPDEAVCEEREWWETWGIKWAAKQTPDVLQAFRQYLCNLNTEEKLNKGEVVELDLRCGHSFVVWSTVVFNLTSESCLAAECPTCGKKIMTDFIVDAIAASQEAEKAQMFRKENKAWVRLDHDIADEELSFEVDELFVALDMSLRSLSPPKMACPVAYSFGDYGATKAVLEEFRKQFEDSDDIFDVSGTELVEHLYHTAMDAKIGSSTVPVDQAVRRPRFREDLRVWLRRAVNLTSASSKWTREESRDEASLLRAMGGLDMRVGLVEVVEAMFEVMGI